MTELRVTYLRDYRPPVFLVETVDLFIDLHEHEALVTATMNLRRNREATAGGPLLLEGRDLTLVTISMDGRRLAEGDYRITGEHLEIPDAPDVCRVDIVTRLEPQSNKTLEGLYKSNDLFCTQCEAMGFRKITYFPDRPDVMAIYNCTIAADQSKYPVLLSNGNLMESGPLEGGRHYARWHDPHRKPSYLFAMVAGNLAVHEDRFRTKSGKDVALRIFVEQENIDKCAHAMESLKKAMRWDEEIFGREYDLDGFMIVAVKDFNMGAMENKGLNIFNAKYVLARPETATDIDFQNIEGVIAHEYFHNWTGNRITLKNWFQLSLKEGLTVFRDQEFSADMGSRPVKRIGDVRRLKTFQFAEDSGPMAHPVRPESYIQMNNFYTQTVYEKGAEVVRMLYRLLGPDRFHNAMDLYFHRFDGQAVTTDDFVTVMEEAGGRDLVQFRRWYSQAGTPEVVVKRQYDEPRRLFRLECRQSCPPTPGQPVKQPFHIPIAVGLIRPDGSEIPLGSTVNGGAPSTTAMLELRETEQVFCFPDIDVEPIPSLLRGFSAPVKLDAGYTDEELSFLMAMDTDPFVRWDAGQRFMMQRVQALIDDFRNGRELCLEESVFTAWRKILQDRTLDRAFVALMLTLPSEAEIGQRMSDLGQAIDPDAVHHVRCFIRERLATSLRDDFLTAYQENRSAGPYRITSGDMARRSLQHLALGYLSRTREEADIQKVYTHFFRADNMTDELAALALIADFDDDRAAAAVQRFYEKWQGDDLVLEKWFSVQAGAASPHALSRVRELMRHPKFSLANPNRVRAVIGTFCGMNPWQFHQVSGDGYRFLADQVLALNAINPQMAARMVSLFNPWKKYDAVRQGIMRQALERIRQAPRISSDVAEIVTKALDG
ncbi:MAG: aminopeptidase N [Thermodesulfobacteriota bacterium]